MSFFLKKGQQSRSRFLAMVVTVAMVLALIPAALLVPMDQGAYAAPSFTA